ncbi:hypothetical protein BGZ58_006035, partial [Dissophora ornata]
MGIPGLWPLIKKEGYVAPVRTFHVSPPSNPVHVDVLGSFFSDVRRCFLRNNSEVACIKFEQYLISRHFPKTSVILHIDGPSPPAKSATNDYRRKQRQKSFDTANNLLDRMEGVVRNRNQGKLKKRDFKALGKAIAGSFYFTHDLRQELIQFLHTHGWNV